MRVLTTETPVKDNSCSSTPRPRSLVTLSTDGHPEPRLGTTQCGKMHTWHPTQSTGPMKAGDRTTEGTTTERTQNQLTHVQSLQATGKTREDPEPATWANGDRKRPRGSRADETRQATAMEREDGNKTPKTPQRKGDPVSWARPRPRTRHTCT